jgi:hypothetical protein
MIILQWLENIKTFFFNLSFSVRLLMIFASVIIIYELLKQILVKGDIEHACIVHDQNIPYLLMVNDYAVHHTSKSGMFYNHEFRIKRINLKDQLVDYDVRLSRFSTGMMGGVINVIGINPDFIFLTSDNRDLVVVNNKLGKQQCDKKKIIKKNRQLKGFDERLCKYSHVNQTIVIYDNKGDAYLLNPETVKAEKVNFNLHPADRIYNISLNDLPKVILDKNYLGKEEPNEYFAGSNKYDVDFIPEPGSMRYFVHIKTNFSNEKPKKLYDSFLNPKTLNLGHSSIPYLTRTPPSVIIAHARSLNPKTEDIYVSRVNHLSEKLWTRSLPEIVKKPKFSEDMYLYYTVYKQEIYFMAKEMSSPKISIGSVDKRSGRILKPPKLFINRRFW